jgi:hypothetical protein
MLLDSPNVKHKAGALELKALERDTFDSRYVKQGARPTTKPLRSC